jgi:hypothetical protein
MNVQEEYLYFLDFIILKDLKVIKLWDINIFYIFINKK